VDFLTKRIQEKLLARGRAEQARADEWRRSLKPTVYRGNNLFQELGGEPLEGRYLGQQGLVPGQSVPNIGRNPNKPVIPGLPVEPIVAPEEGGVIKKDERIYSAIFTREVPGGRTQWTDLEMMQRQSLFNRDDWQFIWNFFAIVQSALNDRKYYYWNGSSLQELFTRTSSTLLDSGSTTFSGTPNETKTLYTYTVPGNQESGMPSPNRIINSYNLKGTGLLLIYTYTGAESTPLVNGTFKWEVVGDPLVNGQRYFIYLWQYEQSDINNIPSPWQVQINARPGTITWELYEVNSFGAYFTFSSRGTSFAHITNGHTGDEKIRIRYFTGSGKQPSTLTLTEINQANSELYWDGTNSYPVYDWRSHQLTSTDNAVNETIPTAFSGVGDQAYQYANVPGNGYNYGYSASSHQAGTIMNRLFGIGETGEVMSIAQSTTITAFDPVSGAITNNANTDIGFDLTFPNIDLSSFGEEGVDYFLEDICVPDFFTASVGTFSLSIDYLFPMLGIIPFSKNIYF
jgi:hypothetical protein